MSFPIRSQRGSVTFGTLDMLGVGASSICAIHCLLLPLVIGFLPMACSQYMGHPLTHKLLAAPVLLFCLTAVIPGYLKHRSIPILMLMLSGLSLVLFATFSAAILPGEIWEIAIISIGNCLVIGSHFLNRMCCISHTH